MLTLGFLKLWIVSRAGNIAKYDYGDESENKAHYGQPTPPLYSMTRIPKDIPLFLGYGGKDTLSDVNDVQLWNRILSISFEMERPPVNGGDLLHNYPRSKIGHII